MTTSWPSLINIATTYTTTNRPASGITSGLRPISRKPGESGPVTNHRAHSSPARKNFHAIPRIFSTFVYNDSGLFNQIYALECH